MLKVHWPYYPEIPVLSIYLRNNENVCHAKTNLKVCSSFIHHSPKLDTNRVCLRWWMHNQMVWPHEDCYSVMQRNAPLIHWKHRWFLNGSCKCKKPDTENYTLYDKDKVITMEMTVVARGWGRGATECKRSRGIFRADKNAFCFHCGDASLAVHICQNYTLKFLSFIA